ncbi:MAG: hypothetical protein AAF593_11850 [Planctomycetota bacterium]
MPMYCRRCHYNLQGLDSGVCPECGLAFDPRQPRTYWDGKLPLMRWFWTWSIFFTFATFAGGVLMSLANELFFHGQILELGWPEVVWSTGYLPFNGSRSHWHIDGILLNLLYSAAFGAGAGGLLVLVRKTQHRRPHRD